MEIEQIYCTILDLVLVLILAKLLGEMVERLGQPAVLGELLAGIILGGSVLRLINIEGANRDILLLLAELGAIVLLFEIGLESDIEEFLRVGPSSLLVALIGVTGPFVLGYFASKLLGLDTVVAVFMGATLTATSVGITARTLSDLGQIRTVAAKILLGAAVIDDVLGLIILAAVSGVVTTGAVCCWGIAKMTLLAVLFLIGATTLGIRFAPAFLNLATKLRTRGILTVSAFVFCLALAYFAHELHLATIVGAFAAGLVLARTEEQAHIQERMKPVADIFVPVFFVVLGLSVDLRLLNPFYAESRESALLLLVLLFVAVVTKLFAGLGVIRRGVNRLLVGVGMIPRGEVGLIFASIGYTRHVITQAEYGVIVGVVFITTLITPLLLKLVLRKKKVVSAAEAES